MRSKNTPFTIILVVFIIVFVIIPFFSKDKMSRPGASRSRIENLIEYEKENGSLPEELVLNLLIDNDITFIGEPGKYHETTAFVSGLIPRLQGTGVSIVAVSFLDYRDQDAADFLVSSDSFDEALANQLLFNSMIMNGYSEYRDLLKEVWHYNQGLSPDGKPLRILGLNPEQDWSAIRTNEDSSDPEIIHKVYASGVPDTFMADVLKKEVLEPGAKALVYAGLPHTLSSLQIAAYREKMAENGFSDDLERMAWHIRQLPGVASCTVFLHAPWTVEKSKYGIDYPMGGVLDSFMEKYPADGRRMGFLTSGTPFGELSTAPGSFGAEKSHLLGELCDAYILLGPIGEYTPFTAIPGFINSDNFERAVENFPGPKESMAQSPRELNEFIAGTAANSAKILEKFKR